MSRATKRFAYLVSLVNRLESDVDRCDLELSMVEISDLERAIFNSYIVGSITDSESRHMQKRIDDIRAKTVNCECVKRGQPATMGKG